MPAKPLIIAAALAVAAGAAQAQTAKKPAPAPAKAAAFDARDPASVAAYLTTLGATAKPSPGQGAGFYDVTTPGGNFGLQFVGCDKTGKACEALAFSTAFERKGATMAHLNAFNRSQVSCRGFMGDDGRPNVMYSTLVTARMPAEEMRLHVGAWQGCLALFSEFSRDPAGFLARQP